MPKKMVGSHAFSDSDSDDGMMASPPKRIRKEVELTPPHAFEDSEDLPDTEPLSDTDGSPTQRLDSKTSAVQSESSEKSSNKENRKGKKEAEKRDKAAERLRKKEEKEAVKANSRNQKE